MLLFSLMACLMFGYKRGDKEVLLILLVFVGILGVSSVWCCGMLNTPSIWPQNLKKMSKIHPRLNCLKRNLPQWKMVAVVYGRKEIGEHWFDLHEMFFKPNTPWTGTEEYNRFLKMVEEHGERTQRVFIRFDHLHINPRHFEKNGYDADALGYLYGICLAPDHPHWVCFHIDRVGDFSLYIKDLVLEHKKLCKGLPRDLSRGKLQATGPTVIGLVDGSRPTS